MPTSITGRSTEFQCGMLQRRRELTKDIALGSFSSITKIHGRCAENKVCQDAFSQPQYKGRETVDTAKRQIVSTRFHEIRVTRHRLTLRERDMTPALLFATTIAIHENLQFIELWDVLWNNTKWKWQMESIWNKYSKFNSHGSIMTHLGRSQAISPLYFYINIRYTFITAQIQIFGLLVFSVPFVLLYCLTLASGCVL